MGDGDGLVGLPHELLLLDCAVHLARVDEVELLLIDPVFVCVVDHEGEIWGDAWGCQCGFQVERLKWEYNWGWIGLRSVPITTAEGCASAMWLSERAIYDHQETPTKLDGP